MSIEKKYLGEKILLAVVVVLVLCIMGLCIYGAVDIHRNDVQVCTNDAKILNTSGRWKAGECQLLTTQGVWLSELDYLLLTVVNCQKPSP